MTSHRLSLQIDAFADLVFTMDLAGRLAEVGDSSRRILGREPEDLAGCGIEDFSEESYLPGLRDFLQLLREGGTPAPLDLEIRGVDAIPIPVQLTARPLRDGKTIVGSQCLIRETRRDREHVDLLLEHSRRFSVLREIAETLPAGGNVDTLLQEILLRLLSLGRFQAAATYRWQDDERMSRVARVGHPELTPPVLSFDGSPDSPLPASYRSYPRLLSSDMPVGRPPLLEALHEKEMRGSVILPLVSNRKLRGITVIASKRALDLDDEMKAMLRWLGQFLGQALENHSLREESGELRARFKDLTESSADHIWEVDRHGRYVYNSPSITHAMGYLPEDVHGQRPVDFVHPEDREETRRYLIKLQRERKPLGGMINRVFNAEGKIVYIESRAFPIFDARIKVCGYRGVDRNITDWFESRRVLEETLVGTCEALSRMVELRDPYTKGHSVRVAQLMILIGEAMNRSAYELQGLRLMGLLHDIGKIGIPTEILSKPGRLSPEELDLMRQHPTMGYEILKDISFPWPVAAVVYQHHERLDGSGYPQSLMGDEIMWQVRLMAVADLLEAMATDRPYRPGLGRARALKELDLGRGLLYDPEIVDAVMRLEEEGALAEFFQDEVAGEAPDPPALPRRSLGTLMEEDMGAKPTDHPDFVLLTLYPEESSAPTD